MLAYSIPQLVDLSVTIAVLSEGGVLVLLPTKAPIWPVVFIIVMMLITMATVFFLVRGGKI